MTCPTAVIAMYHIVRGSGGTNHAIVVLKSGRILIFGQGAWCVVARVEWVGFAQRRLYQLAQKSPKH